MVIGDAIGRAFDEIAMRERDAMGIFAPGAQPSFDDARVRAPAQFTLDPLSAAPPDGTLFMTRAQNGTLLFSADGSFALRDGVLVDSGGCPVLGYPAAGAPLAELHADPVDVALGYTRDASIAADGIVSYERPAIDPRTGLRSGQRVAIGRIALARFPAGTRLQRVDLRHQRADGVEPYVDVPERGGFGALATHRRAASGIAVDRALEGLQQAYLAFDAVRAAGAAQGATAKVAMDLLK